MLDDATPTGAEEKQGATATLERQDSSAVDELNRLAENADFGSGADRYLSDKLGISPDTTEAIQKRVEGFQKFQTEFTSSYLQESHKPTPVTEDFFYVLNGWDYQEEQPEVRGVVPNPAITKYLLPDQYRNTSGGYYIRWHGKGIVINPGHQFLKNFHSRGLHVQDIDFVVVTRDNPAAFAEVKAIYDLNYQLNMSGADLHIIHYYLNQQAHRGLSPMLKANFKQERNTVHCLELFVDSPDIETAKFDEGITLNYFPTQASDTRVGGTGAMDAEKSRSVLGMQLVLESPGKDKVTIGYVSGTAWSPMLANHLAGSDLLITGMENTCADDYGKIKYNPDCLGYFGTYSLMEQVCPKVLLFCEFGGRQGDIRMEIAKKMRQEYAFSNNQNTVVLPGDTGLCMDLSTMQICCEVTQELVDPTQIRVTKSCESFGRLRFLSPSCFI